MRVRASVDMESIASILDSTHPGRDKAEYQRSMALMVAEVNSAIDGQRPHQSVLDRDSPEHQSAGGPP